MQTPILFILTLQYSILVTAFAIESIRVSCTDSLILFLNLNELLMMALLIMPKFAL